MAPALVVIKKFAIRVLLELMHESLPFFLGHRTVQSDIIQFLFFQQRLDQIQHGRPLGKQDDFAIFFMPSAGPKAG